MVFFRKQKSAVRKENRRAGPVSKKKASSSPQKNSLSRNKRKKTIEKDDVQNEPKLDTGDVPEDAKGDVRKILIGLLKFTGVLLAVGFVIWGGVLAYGHATTSDYFAIRYIKVEGQKRMSNEEILQAGQITLGQNIFSIDTGKTAEKIKEHPWILDASMSLKLPRTISVEVKERKTELLVLFDVPYLVDDEGDIFKRWVIGDPIPSPLITGITKEELITDEEAVKNSVLEGIALARSYRASGLDRFAELSEIHREIDGAFSLTIGKDPFYVQFGHGPYRKKIRRLAKLLRKMKADGEQPGIVFFNNPKRPDRVTVKLKGKTNATAEKTGIHE